MGCNDCAACATGQQQWCSRKVVLGVAPEVSAAFADRVAVPAANIVRLPDEMPAELGALVEPLAVGYHSVRRGEPVPEDRVLVIGGGPIGQACLLAARRLGVENLAVSDVSRVPPGSVRRARCPGDRPIGRRPAGAVSKRLGRAGDAGGRRGRREPDGRRRARRLRPRRPDRAGRNGIAPAGPCAYAISTGGAEPDRFVHLQPGRVRRYRGLGRHRPGRDRRR